MIKKLSDLIYFSYPVFCSSIDRLYKFRSFWATEENSYRRHMLGIRQYEFCGQFLNDLKLTTVFSLNIYLVIILVVRDDVARHGNSRYFKSIRGQHLNLTLLI